MCCVLRGRRGSGSDGSGGDGGDGRQPDEEEGQQRAHGEVRTGQGEHLCTHAHTTPREPSLVCCTQRVILGTVP